MQDELARFVASLAIPERRRSIVLAELIDHVESAREAARRQGRDPEAAALAALGDLEQLRRAYETVEPAFAITRRHAVARGLIAGLGIALAIDLGGAALAGVVGAVVALAIAALFAPPHALALLRAELRAPRIRGTLGLGRGVPIGPAGTYIYTVMSAPFVIWIGLIIYRVRAGLTELETPPSAFAVGFALCALLVVEGVRARRAAAEA